MNTLLKTLWDFTKTLTIAAFLAFFCIRGFIFEPFRIPSGSMMPTLLVGDYLFVSKFAYGNRLPLTDWFFWQKDPERGDILVFKNSHSNLPGSFFGLGTPMFIKRVIALPGDTIAYERKQLIVNGVPVPLAATGEYQYTSPAGVPHNAMRYDEYLGQTKHDVLLESTAPEIDLRPMTVPKNTFVMMGDNRDNSRDSRAWNYPNWGFVPREDIMGRAEFIFWSWDKYWQPRWVRLLDSLRPQKVEPLHG